MARNSNVRAARANAIEARTRMMFSLDAVRQRMRPARLARDTAHAMRGKAENVAFDSVEMVVRRPALTATVATAIGLVLARMALKWSSRHKRGRPR